MSAPQLPPDKDQVNRRERILHAAAEEFADKGEAAVRMDEIARRSGVNKQLIYYYFESKAGLYSAVLQMMVEENVSIWEETAKANLMTGVKWLLSSHENVDNKTWSRLLAWEGIEYSGSRGSKKITLQSRRTKAFSGMTDLFHRAQVSGDLAPELDPEMLTILFALINMSQTLLPQLVEMVTGLDPDSKEYEQRLRTFVLDLMQHLGPTGRQQE